MVSGMTYCRVYRLETRIYDAFEESSGLALLYSKSFATSFQRALLPIHIEHHAKQGDATDLWKTLRLLISDPSVSFDSNSYI